MTKTNQYKVLLGGETCREFTTVPIGKEGVKTAFGPTYALTEKMEEGEVFDGSEVWQWCEPNTKGWHTEHTTTMFDNFEDYKGHCATISMISRTAISPIKPKDVVGEEKELPKEHEQTDRGEVIGYLTFENGDLKMNNLNEDTHLQAVDANKEVPDYNTICQNELDKFNSEFKDILAGRNLSIENLTNVYFRQGFVSGQQSQSVESIVGVVLEWVAERATTKEVYSRIQAIDRDGILNMKADIIKELKK